MIFALTDTTNNIIEYPLYERDVRSRNGQVSLPADLNNCSYLTERNWVVVSLTNQPVFDPELQYCKEGTPVLVNGTWQQNWQLFNYDAVTIETNRLAKIDGIKRQLDGMITRLLDDIVRKIGYDSQSSICSYISSSNTTFQHEATVFIAYRDQVWAAGLLIQSNILSGSRIMPTYEELVLELPIWVI